MLTPDQRYEIGKRAAEHGVTTTLCYYTRKYRDLPLTETSTRRFKDLNKDHCREQSKPRQASADGNNADPSAGPSEEAHHEEVKELPRKKQGRPLLLPDALDHQVQEYVKDLRKRGLPINTSLVVAAGEGIVMNKYAGSDCGRQHVQFNYRLG